MKGSHFLVVLQQRMNALHRFFFYIRRQAPGIKIMQSDFDCINWPIREWRRLYRPVNGWTRTKKDDFMGFKLKLTINVNELMCIITIGEKGRDRILGCQA